VCVCVCVCESLGSNPSSGVCVCVSVCWVRSLDLIQAWMDGWMRGFHIMDMDKVPRYCIVPYFGN